MLWRRYVDDTFVVQQQSYKIQLKIKILPQRKASVIYWFKCDRIDCEDEYIGESSRTFGEKYKEHLKAPSPIFEHQNNTVHITSVENFKIIGREGHNMARAIKEAIYIRVNNPTLNRNIESTTCHTFGIEYCTPSQN